jgi:hypothetical protein
MSRCRLSLGTGLRAFVFQIRLVEKDFEGFNAYVGCLLLLFFFSGLIDCNYHACQDASRLYHESSDGGGPM